MAEKHNKSVINEPDTAEKNVIEEQTVARKSVKRASRSAPQKPRSKEDPSPVKAEKEEFHVVRELTPNTYVTVRNGFNGKLIYKSHRTNEKIVWESFGAAQDMELQELKSARNSSRAFFENNWFMFDDPEVIAYLGAERFYQGVINIDDIDVLLMKSFDEIKDSLNKIPAGQKKAIAYRAKQLIESGDIDSIKVINMLEETLEARLIER